MHDSVGEDTRYHRFHRVQGGFLQVETAARAIHFRLREVPGKVVHEFSKSRRVQLRIGMSER